MPPPYSFPEDYTRLPDGEYVCCLDHIDHPHSPPFYQPKDNQDVVCSDCCRPMVITQKGLDWLKKCEADNAAS